MMGVALEWLGTAGCRTLAESILTKPEVRRGEVWAHCPFHQEKTPGGAFSYNFQKDTAKCQSCGATGDLAAVWCELKGYGKESKDGFLEFKKQFGKDAPPAQRNPMPEKRERPRALDPENRDGAPERWKERARSYVMHSFERLMNSAGALKELEKRWGIKTSTVVAYGFGMNDQDKWVPVTSWGLPRQERDGKEKKIWLPRGLVMPLMIDREVRKIKIRRPNPETPWGSPRRYWEVEGGENYRFHCYGQADAKVLVVIEAERDAALLVQECGGLSMGAIAGGGATKRPKYPEVISRIRKAEVLLVALDTDGPGAINAVKYWEENFGFAKYWPVPKRYGKDVGEAWCKDLDLREWVLEGLPGWLRGQVEKAA